MMKNEINSHPAVWQQEVGGASEEIILFQQLFFFFLKIYIYMNDNYLVMTVIAGFM